MQIFDNDLKQWRPVTDADSFIEFNADTLPADQRAALEAEIAADDAEQERHERFLAIRNEHETGRAQRRVDEHARIAAMQRIHAALDAAIEKEAPPMSNDLVPYQAPLPPAPMPTSAPLDLVYFNECRDAKAGRYLIKGLLAEGATSSMYGLPKTLKSTLAVDIGVHLAAGKDWRGFSVREVRGVIYFAFERSAQVRKALAAYAVRDGVKELPFAVAGRIINMLDPRCVDMITATIEAAQVRLGVPIGLAIFDTWSKGIAAGGGSEDKAEWQNQAAANLRKVIENLPQLHCMTVGHTGKDVAKGERGSNATQGDRDVGILVEGTTRVRKASIAYANDLPDGELTAFEGEQIVVGLDDDGEPVSAFIVSQRLVTLAPTRNMTTRQDLAMKALGRVINEHSDSPPEGSDLPQRPMATVERWREELLRSGVVKRDGANPRADFTRLRSKMVEIGAVEERDGFVWRIQPDGNVLPPIPSPPA